MEIIKELPEVFEEFAEQRKKSFLEIKEIKEQNIPIIGSYCGYFPQEVAAAMGAACVGLCSMSDETIPVAEQTLPQNLCPLIKASYGFAVTDKCPFFYFSDLVVGETTCDGKKKMYEYLSDIKDVFILELPQKQTPAAKDYFKGEILRLKEYLEEKFGVEITEEKLRHAVKIGNDNRRALKAFYELMKFDPAPMKGEDLYNVLYGTTFKFDREKIAAEIKALTEKIKAEYAAGKNVGKKPRILITGCPMGGATMKVVRTIEENGGSVVAFENCSGAKTVDRLIKEDAADIYDAIAERYLSIGCSVMSPNPNRFTLLDELIDEYKIDAVVEMTLQACHTYNVEAGRVGAFVREQKHIPYLHIETDYSQSDIGQLNTRVSALLEML